MKKLLIICTTTIFGLTPVMSLKTVNYSSNSETIKVNRIDNAVNLNRVGSVALNEYNDILNNLALKNYSGTIVIQDNNGLQMINLMIIKFILDFMIAKDYYYNMLNEIEPLKLDQEIYEFYTKTMDKSRSTNYGWNGTESKWYWFGAWKWYMTWNWFTNKIGNINVAAGLAAIKKNIIASLLVWIKSNAGLAFITGILSSIAPYILVPFVTLTVGCIVGNQIWNKKGIVIRYYTVVLIGCWNQ